MTAGGVYARRYGRVLLADPQRRPEVFTAARARGEEPPRGVEPGWVTFWKVLAGVQDRR